MTPLEEAVEHNLDLHAQLSWQLDKLREIGQWDNAKALAYNIELAEQRLETLLDFIFEPQDEISREAFELAWEERHGKLLKRSLEGARSILFIPSATEEEDG